LLALLQLLFSSVLILIKLAFIHIDINVDK
jgi:hypothetical protein